MREHLPHAVAVLLRQASRDEADDLVALDEDPPPERGLQEPRPEPTELKAGEDGARGEDHRQEDRVDELGDHRTQQALQPR